MALNRFLNLAVMSFCYLVLFLPYLAFGSSPSLFVPVEISRSPLGLCALAVTRHGYKCQEFEVKTDDGYILSVQRIPEGRTEGGRHNKPPVLLQHGVLVDGVIWLLNSPEKTLPLILADNGFDVWISNVRGTRYSRRHVTLDPSNPEYWDWSWDELVLYDLRSVTEFVCKQTGQKIHYVGHSLGTLMALASFAEGKEIDKIRSAVLLSPIAYLSHMTTPLGIIGAKAFLGEIELAFGLAEFNPQGEAVYSFLKSLCATPGMNCLDLLSAFTGKNCCLNASYDLSYLKYELQSTATKNLVHLSQSIRDGILSKYDYGSANSNMEHYGESNPPVYDLRKIPHDFPLFLSYGGQDALSDTIDVAILLDCLNLHDIDKLRVQYVKDYAHLDFVMGVTANDIVYNQILAFFKNLH